MCWSRLRGRGSMRLSRRVWNDVTARAAWTRLAPAFLLTVVVTACGSGQGEPAPQETPSIATVSPASIAAPSQIIVVGTALDRVSAARLGSTPLQIVSKSSNSLALHVPAGAGSDYLILVDSAGAVRQSAQPIVVLTPLTISELSTGSVLTGSALTLSGTGLDRAVAVEFTGGAQAPVVSRNGNASVTVDVPESAQSGPVSVLSLTGERFTSSTSLAVIPRILISSTSALPAIAGDIVELSGSGLAEVSKITVAGVPATVVTRTASRVSFAVPSGITCGEILLHSASQSTVSAGRIVASGGCLVRVESIEFAQVLSQPSNDIRQRLVPGREAWVRAYVVSSHNGVGAPLVRLTAFDGNSILGSVTMTGPSLLPQLAATEAIPGALRDDGSATFMARIDGSWVRSGLRVEVTADTAAAFGTPTTATSAPAVGTSTRIDIVLVPLVSGTATPALAPNAAQEAADEIVRRLPVARDNIRVSVRAPYTLGSVTNGVDTSNEWSSALSELEALRRIEAPGRQYFGLSRPMATSGTAGIGYVNVIDARVIALSSMGWDTSRSSWLRTMIHELGHNYSRRHSPCGNAANADPSYPYSGGLLGRTPLFDALSSSVVSPAGLPDVMGYCGGRWFSDYNVREIQRFLEWHASASAVAQAKISADEVDASEVLHVSGVIGMGSVEVHPVSIARGRATLQTQGEYTLRLHGAVGSRVLEVPFDAVLVDHAMPPQKHFHVSLPNPGLLTAIEVSKGGAVLARRVAEKAQAESPNLLASKVMANLVESNGLLTLTWNASRYPKAIISHVVDGKRRVLALRAEGGLYSVDSETLEARGIIELGLSDGINSEIHILAR